MKIAILTLPLETNYGGNLQAYALYTTLTKMGNDVELINYRHKQVSDFRKVLSTLKQKVIYRRNVFYFFDKEQAIINQNHEEFINSYIKRSSPIYSTEQLVEYFNINSFDSIIVGSDQVWRFEYPPKIENYFLEFLEKNSSIKKIAYAASFGIDSWNYTDHVTQKVRKLVQKFYYISVREISGVQLCKSKLYIDAKHVVDPTLLLSPEEYLQIINVNKKTNNEGKILTYILDDNTFKTQIIAKIKNHLNKDTFIAQPVRKSKKRMFEKNLESYMYPSIENWVRSFYDASFIITDSFHGTVFAIIFKKPFIAIVNKERGASRFESLLGKLMLENRVVDENTIITNELFENKIDYNEVSSLLGEWITYSYNELKTALVDKE